LSQVVEHNHRINNSIRQALVPAGMRGRAVIRVVTWGVGPFGALLGGLLAQFYAVRASLIIAAIGTFAAFVVIAASPVRRVRGI
jgi:hypothetical protein